MKKSEIKTLATGVECVEVKKASGVYAILVNDANVKQFKKEICTQY